jgi:predicted membrane channel-forming protein YqfA (hemolysin III family)
MSFFTGPTFANFLANAFAIFVFILWLWLFVATATDLFRRRDISGFGKVLWVILLIVLPYIGVFAYLLTQSGGMAERNMAQTQQARDELRGMVGFSAADELIKLARLRSQNAISEEEYLTLRGRVVA